MFQTAPRTDNPGWSHLQDAGGMITRAASLPQQWKEDALNESDKARVSEGLDRLSERAKKAEERVATAWSQEQEAPQPEVSASDPAQTTLQSTRRRLAIVIFRFCTCQATRAWTTSSTALSTI